MTATAPHLSLVPDLDPTDEAPAALEGGALDCPVCGRPWRGHDNDACEDQGRAAAPVRPTEDRDGRPLATPHTDTLAPDWAAARSLTAVWGVLLGTTAVGAASGGPEAAVTCGLAGLAIVYVVGHITGRS